EAATERVRRPVTRAGDRAARALLTDDGGHPRERAAPQAAVERQRAPPRDLAIVRPAHPPDPTGSARFSGTPDLYGEHARRGADVAASKREGHLRRDRGRNPDPALRSRPPAPAAPRVPRHPHGLRREPLPRRPPRAGP